MVVVVVVVVVYFSGHNWVMVFFFRTRGFLTSRGEQRRYLNLGPVLPSPDSEERLQDPGNFAVYPVPLDRIRSWGGGGTPIPGRSPLRVELSFTAPLEESETWYMLAIYEHAGRAEFHQEKFVGSFETFSWQNTTSTHH